MPDDVTDRTSLNVTVIELPKLAVLVNGTAGAVLVDADGSAVSFDDVGDGFAVAVGVADVVAPGFAVAPLCVAAAAGLDVAEALADGAPDATGAVDATPDAAADEPAALDAAADTNAADTDGLGLIL